jgi:hypothetical protein
MLKVVVMKLILSFYSDIEKGLNVEKFVSSKLCTSTIMLVKHTYDDVPSGISTFQYLNQTRGMLHEFNGVF